MRKVSHLPPGAAKIASPDHVLKLRMRVARPLACERVFINQSGFERFLRV
jgi:hypothetical protein